MPLAAQVGPIQPVLVLTDGKLETTHDRPSFDEDFSIPVDVYVAADGSVTNVVVTSSSKNFNADAVAADYMRTRQFLPALDERGQAVEGMAKVNVNMFKRGTKKVVRVTLKPPPMAVETERLRRMMCADFVWEVNRMQNQAGVREPSVETMPYVSAHMYAEGKDMAGAVAEKFWDTWPKTLDKVLARCEKAPEMMYFTEVLVPALDGTMPTRDTATAATK
ncbi:MAG TPA: hypothetical protein VFU13_09675 [Steroidobacteraceae bacterium]|nr:hypothetical protein [Steroidobacteraceae bacterium]